MIESPALDYPPKIIDRYTSPTTHQEKYQFGGLIPVGPHPTYRLTCTNSGGRRESRKQVCKDTRTDGGKEQIGKRPRTVLLHILKHGFITAEILDKQYGYKHASPCHT